MGIFRQTKHGFSLSVLSAAMGILIGFSCVVSPVWAQGDLPGGELPPPGSAREQRNASQQSAQEGGQLQAVVVTASGFEQLVEDAPASISVITREDLENRAYSDVTDALRDVPGVVVTGGGSTSDISIRGMTGGYTMLLIDGRRVNSRETRPNSDGPGIEQGWLPPLEAIERIEVVRGPMSSLYGSDAMGGVVNIITRKVPTQWMGSLRGELTQQEHSRSGNIYQGNFYLAGPIKDDILGLQVYGRRSEREEDHQSGGYKNQETTSGTIKVSLAPVENHQFVAEVGYDRQTRDGTPGRTLSATSKPSRSEYTRNSYALTHTGRWGFGISDTYIQREEIDNPGRNMFLRNTEINTQWSIPYGTNVLTLGASYKKEELTDKGNQLTTRDRLDRYQWAVFAENDWAITDSFVLTTGLRMNHDEFYGTDWTPRIYGVWHMTDQFSLKGGVSTGYKTPTLRAAVAEWGQTTGGGSSNGVIMGNPDLEPEKSVSAEVGLVWNNRENFESSLTAYVTRFKDKITEVRVCQAAGACTTPVAPGQVFDFISERTNVDKAQLWGIEATMTWELRPDVRWTANYTYTTSEQKSGPFSGQPLNQMPRHMVNTTLDWQVSDPLNIWGRLNYRSRTSEYLSRTRMSTGTPEYAFVDVGLNYRLTRNATVSFAIYNLFDKEIDYATYKTVLDGRCYWLALTVGF